jgi:hypothetical protein
VWLVTGAIVVASLSVPSVAWARYRATGSETNTFATHVLLTPGTPTCGGINLLSVPLSWSAPSDAAYVQSYELGTSSTSGSGYTYTPVAGTSTTVAIPSLGTRYFVVRSVNHNWRSGISGERTVVGALVVATCP